MKVTKGELKEFVKSYEIHKMNDSALRNSLDDLAGYLEMYILFGKPNSYILLDWEYKLCLKMGVKKDSSGERCELEPHFLSYKREIKLKEII
jgi:hypothetical protein